jgi:hypothetical protein
MQLPSAHTAIIRLEKLRNYLLSVTHPVGRSKARFFRAAGFNELNLNEFKEALLALCRTNEVQQVEKTPFGLKYVIDGVIHSPLGKELLITTVWIIVNDQETPRFVTAYPLK